MYQVSALLDSLVSCAPPHAASTMLAVTSEAAAIPLRRRLRPVTVDPPVSDRRRRYVPRERATPVSCPRSNRMPRPLGVNEVPDCARESPH